jgi:hypothetical protein
MRRFDEDGAMAIVFANTKRKKRTEDLLTVAEAFEFLAGRYGSTRAVAAKVGLSPEIVREFRKLLTLPEGIKQIVRSRKIDRLDIAYKIATLRNERSQIAGAKEAMGLTTDDVRDMKRLMEAGGLSARESKKQVLESKLKGLHVFVMDFDDATYRGILQEARRCKRPPAELVKGIVLDWVREIRKKGGAND